MLVVAAGLCSHILTQSYLDRDRHYTAAVAQLPYFNGSDGSALLKYRGYDFKVRFAGFEENPDGETVILLHGFPVTSAMWLPLMTPLEDAGYRVVAPDQRGYSPLARPQAIDAYKTNELVADVLALADALQLSDFHLVGHDWGAVVGWQVAQSAPHRLLSWSAMSIPHPAAFAAALQHDPDQAKRSRYLRLFALPILPEMLFAWNDFDRLRATADTLPAEEGSDLLAMYREAGAASAVLNWYRAMMRDLDDSLGAQTRVDVPTLFIWGSNDPVLSKRSVEEQSRYVAGPYTELKLEAGHRLLAGHTEEVQAAILHHLVQH
ncbi:MAG: alpha/beta fold hydrolase [Halioglobus sp.]